MNRLLLLNGPNINMLGDRENDIYGKVTLHKVETDLADFVKKYNYTLECFQSNHEGDLIEQIQKANETFDGIIFNPAAYTHTSIALHDAIKAISIPVVEVHLSNIYAREKFRHTSFVAPVSKGQITGFGIKGYKLAAMTLMKNSL